MKTLHINATSGMAGDMFIGALLDMGLPFDHLRAELAKLDLSGYELVAERVNKCGIMATNFTVPMDSARKQPHRHYRDILRIITDSPLAADVKTMACALFDVIAEAEGVVHGAPKEKVHFHEVGAVDSIVDIVGAAIGLAWLDAATITASPVNIGSGVVSTQHGLYPVPTPATAEILKGVPTYAIGPEKELTTPTGAAILKVCAMSFGPQPAMVVKNIGVGAGDYDFDDRPNVVRLFVGENDASGLLHEQLIQLTTTIDDMNPEGYGYATEKFFAAGARDVTLTPIHMKKGRPGVEMNLLFPPACEEKLRTLLFMETSSIGVRRSVVERFALPRRSGSVATPYGPVAVKIVTLPDGSERISPEYESVRERALEREVPFEKVYRAVLTT